MTHTREGRLKRKEEFGAKYYLELKKVMHNMWVK